jgi:hypothetical protein
LLLLRQVDAWLFVGLTSVLAVAQISYINQALARFDGVLFLPLYSAALIMLGTCFGSVYYRELACFGAAEWACFLVGLAVTLGGCLALPALHRSSVAPLLGGLGEEEQEQGQQQQQQQQEEGAVAVGKEGGREGGGGGGGAGAAGVGEAAAAVAGSKHAAARVVQGGGGDREGEGGGGDEHGDAAFDDSARLLGATVTPSGVLVGGGWDDAAPTPKAASNSALSSEQ